MLKATFENLKRKYDAMAADLQADAESHLVERHKQAAAGLLFVAASQLRSIVGQWANVTHLVIEDADDPEPEPAKSARCRHDFVASETRGETPPRCSRCNATKNPVAQLHLGGDVARAEPAISVASWKVPLEESTQGTGAAQFAPTWAQFAALDKRVAALEAGQRILTGGSAPVERRAENAPRCCDTACRFFGEKHWTPHGEKESAPVERHAFAGGPFDSCAKCGQPRSAAVHGDGGK